MKWYSIFISLFFVSAAFLTSCYKPIEGCTNADAENYTFIADEPCNDCCTFPVVSLKVTHKWGSETFQNNKEYTNNLGSTVIVTDQKIAFSDIIVKDNNGLPITNTASTTLTIAGQSTTLPLNYCLLSQTLNKCGAGRIKYTGAIKSIDLLIGTNDRFNQADSASVARDAALSRSEGMYLGGEYQTMYINYQPFGQPQKFQLYIPEDLLLSIPLTPSYSSKQGIAKEIPITINYQKLYNNIDWLKDNQSAIKSKILLNFPTAITGS